MLYTTKGEALVADPISPDSSASPADAMDWIMRSRRDAQTAAVTSLEDNPDDAGRAMELSQATGANPALVYGNLDEFQQQHKAALTSALLTNNQYLRQYALSHPLAPKVSADDWGQLDAVSQALTRLGDTSFFKKAVESFKEGYGEGPAGLTRDEMEKLNRLTGNPVVSDMLNRAFLNTPFGQVYQAQRIGSGMITGLTGVAGETAKRLGVEKGPDYAEALLQTLTDPGLAASLGPAGEAAELPFAMLAHNRGLYHAAHYITAGEEPPVGLHPAVDQLHQEQAKLDVKALDETFKEAQKSSTRERSPELFADFIRQHTDNRIGISAEGLRQLYGDGRPEVGDTKLGWAPNILDQYDLALATGGDIEIPLADWLAKASPETADAVHDFLRVRPGGLTLDDLQAAKGEEPKEVEPRPPSQIPEVEAVRAATSTAEPLLRQPQADRSIVPASATHYEGGEIEAKGGEKFTPYMNFPLRDALNKIKIDTTGIPAVLQEFYKDRLAKLAGDVPIRIVKDEDMKRISGAQFGEGRGGDNYALAFYSPSTDEIYMSDRLAAGKSRAPGFAQYAVLHEGGHALSVHAMEENPELRAKVVSMMKSAQKFLEINEPDLLKEGGHAYAFQNEREFWAQAWSDTQFQHSLSMMPMSVELAQDLGMKSPAGKSIYDAFRRIVKLILEKVFPGHDIPDTMVDGLFHLQREFEQVEAKARGVTLGKDEALAAKPEGDDLFTKAAAIGMTKDQYSRYQELIAKRQAEDLEHQQARADKLARQQQTKEWKENFASTRKEVEADLSSRPDLAADRFLRTGELYGKKAKRVKIASADVPEELRRQLPNDYLSPDGVRADDLAGLFGYQSGEQLLRRLAGLEGERKLEGLTPAAHFSRMVDAETEREMRKRFGNLEENILEEAKDHVISQTQMDLLHEEMLALGQKAGGELAISKEDVKDWVKQEFNRAALGQHSTDKYLAQAGRAGAKAERALLDDKPTDAFKAKQEQYLSFLLANEAKRLEKERKGFDRIAKRFAKREVSGVPSEYTNWIHDILMRTGNVVRRSVQDLQEAIGREAQGDLEKFVQAKNYDSAIWEGDENSPSDFQVMPVAPFLFDSNYRKPVEQMTPEEFRAVHNSLKTLIKNGADEKKILVAGEKRDLTETISTMTSQLAKLFEGKEKQYAFGHKDQGVGHALRTYWASLLQIESIFNRFDRGDPKGIFRKAVTQPIFEGSHTANTLETKYSRLYKGLPDFGDLKKRVENTLFRDPLEDGELKEGFTRGNLLAVLQNVGNASQLDKLARGYKIQDKNSIMQWLFQNTTKEDWDRAQKLGDIFEQLFEESAGMYQELSGVAPAKIDIRPIETPFGTYRGWYHPIVYDPLRPGSSKKLMGPSPLEDGSYYRVATPSGYTKARTGYAAPIKLDFDAIPTKMKAMINDIAMRPAVTEVAKVFYDPKFQMAVTKTYSKEIKDLLIPYLKDIAGQRQYKDAAQTAAMRYLEYARQNVTATLIGLNPSTVLKHGPTAAALSIKEVGAASFLRELTGLLSMNDELGERNWTFAMKGGIVDGKPWGGSEELQRRHRNWQETLSGAQQDLFGENTLRNSVIKFGATPVAISDLLSAVPTWLAAYKDQIRAGAEHGDAVAFADTAVRRAHGSSAVAARPRIMRGGPLAQLATPFYTFFNEMFQRQYEMAWRAKDAIEGRSLEQERSGEYKAGLKELPNLAKGLWAFIVFPALVEQLVSPIATGQEPTAVKVASWGARTMASSLPLVRDLVEAYLGGRDPTVGLYATSAKMLTDSLKDIGKGEVSLNKAHAGKTIRHTITAFGALSGLANAQMGRTAQFVYDYSTGQQRPRDLKDVFNGLWHGQMREQRR